MYPKTIKENLKYRVKIYEMTHETEHVGGKLRYTESAREAAGKIRFLAETDVLFYFNTFLWTYDPRTPEKHLPFITWDFQDEYILAQNEAIELSELGNDRQDTYTKKSRDMGVTWMVLGIFDWRWRFKSGEEFRVGSRKQEFVDTSGDMDSLFEKLRYFDDRMPWYLVPKGYDKRKHTPFMKKINPEKKNAIIGEATNKDFARGGRKKAVLYDEFQSWEMADEAWRSATDSTRCKIVLGTPQGSGNKYAELHRTDEVKKKFDLMWFKHPRKTGVSEKHLQKVMDGQVFDKSGGYVAFLHADQNAPKGCYVDQHGKIHSQWYDRETQDRTVDDIKENLDADFLTTGRPVFDTLKCQQKLYESKPPEYKGELIWKVSPHFNPSTGYCDNQDQLVVEFVENMNGVISVWEKPEDYWQWGYLIGADTAEGLEQHDYDSADVIRRFGDKPKIVATLHGHLRMHEYAEELAKLGIYYGKCSIDVERNQHGHGVLAHLVKLYKWLSHKEIFTKGYAEVTDRLGFETTGQSKGVIIGTLGKAISQDEFICLDEGFWNETLTYVNDNGEMEAQGKSHGEKCFDDRVMSKAIAWHRHLNMPLPAQVRKIIPLKRWLLRQHIESNQKRIVWFTV